MPVETERPRERERNVTWNIALNNLLIRLWTMICIDGGYRRCIYCIFMFWVDGVCAHLLSLSCTRIDIGNYWPTENPLRRMQLILVCHTDLCECPFHYYYFFFLLLLSTFLFFLFLSQFLVDCPLFLGLSAQQVARIVLGRSLWFGKERKETRESVNKKSKNQTTTHMIYDHNLYELKVPFDFVSLSLCFEYSDDEFLSIFVSLCLWKPRDRCNNKAQRMSLATSPKNACRL